MSESTVSTPPSGAVPLSTPPGSSRRAAMLHRVTQPVIVWVLVIAMIPLSRLFSEHFPSWSLINNAIVLGLFLAVVAFGQGFVILSGGIDLSVPAIIAYGAFFTGALSSAGVPTVLAIILSVAIASAIGLINGVIVARSTFPPFIVTLAVSTVASALLLGISAGRPGQTAPRGLIALFNGSISPAGIPIAVVIFVVVVAVGCLVQFRTSLGRRTYAIGNSMRAATLSGLRVRTTTVLVYWIAAVAYGIAGVLLMGYGSGSDLNIGASWLLPSIAVVVVGGSSIAGGSGSYLSTVGASLLLTILSIDISAIGLSEGVKQVLYGVVILVSLLLSKVGGRRQ